MTVQLRIGGLRPADSPGGRVSVLRGDHILGVLLHHLAAVAAAYHRNLLAEIPDCALHGPGVRVLDLLALPRVAERPDRRDGLRGAERHVDPAAPAATSALGSQPPTGARVTTIYQRDEVRTIDRLPR